MLNEDEMADDKVEVSVEILSEDEEILLDEMISRLVQGRLDIPEEYRSISTVGVSTGDYAYLSVTYRRDPTAEELARSKQQSEVWDRMELARLMNKYGWPPPAKLSS